MTYNVDFEERQKFEELLKQSGNIKKGVLMSAVVTKADNNYIFVNVGLKSDGRIPKQEFYVTGTKEDYPEIGSSITVFLESLEDINGNVSVSYSKALRQSSWSNLEEIFNKRDSVKATIVRKVHGGCIANIQGVSAFLPKNFFAPDVSDPKTMIGKEYSCKIIKMDAQRSNIVISLRDSHEMEAINNFAEGQVVEGVVKSITDTFAILDIGFSITAKLHISEIKWERIESINDYLKVGDKKEVKIISISQGNKINVSLRELSENPFSKKVNSLNLEVGKKIECTVKKIDGKLCILDFNDIECRLKASDYSWNKRLQSFEHLKVGKTLEVKILDFDHKKRRIHVSLKALTQNPIELFESKHKVGEEFEVEVLQLSELGYIVKITDELDGIIPNSANYLDGSLKIGEKTKAYLHKVALINNHIIMGNKKN